LDYVAPDVKTIYLEFAPIIFATFYLANYTAVDESHPNLWVLECGLPYNYVINGIIESRTL